jgi:ribose 5-phosphate isomerase A
MLVGLGTGSTAYWAIKKIGQRVREGLQITAVASSNASEQLAGEENIPLVPLSEVTEIDIYIDGADEVDLQFNLIKGGGGAHLREKILASNSRQFIVIVDQSKYVKKLGKFPLPVEITPFGFNLTLKKLRELPCEVNLRMKDGAHYISDNGNLIADCSFGVIEDPVKLNMEIHAIAGVVETGIFPNDMVSQVIVGYEDGTIQLLK